MSQKREQRNLTQELTQTQQLTQNQQQTVSKDQNITEFVFKKWSLTSTALG
jgi:hypothetical protein